MLPPSVTVAPKAVRVMLVASSVSVILLVAGVGSIVVTTLAPLVLAMVTLMLAASMYASSVGAATRVLPLLAPAATTITAPLLNVTLIGVLEGLLRFAV